MIIISSKYLHLQLPDVVHRPSLVIVVVVGDSGEAAGPLLMRDPALWEVLHGPCATDTVLWDPGRDVSGVEVFTFKYFHID